MSAFPFDVCIGHGPCIDGVSSLAIAWMQLPEAVQLYLSELGGYYSADKKSPAFPVPINSPEGGVIVLNEWKLEGYVPVAFVTAQPTSTFPPALITGRRVLLVDLDPGTAGLAQLIAMSKSTMLLDHHGTFSDSVKGLPDGKTAIAGVETSLAPNVKYFWQPAKTEAGASLTWKYFHPVALVPGFVELMQIVDTWSWEQNPTLQAKAVMEALWERKAFSSFPRIAKYITEFSTLHAGLIAEGAPLLKAKDIMIKTIASKVDVGYVMSADIGPDRKVGGPKTYRVLYCNANVLINEVGEMMREYNKELCTKHHIDFCCTWKYVPGARTVTVSLRSPTSGLALGLVARNVPGVDRGGGHDLAAAFTFTGIECLHLFIWAKPPTLPLPSV